MRPFALQKSIAEHILIILLLMIGATPSRAQTPGADPVRARALRDRPVLELSLKQAVDLALAPEGNARVQLAEEFIRQARDRSAQARAALLPDFESSIGQQNQVRNLAALGIRIQVPLPGFTFPTFVGPFNIFDARATATQNVFDFSSIRRFQASRVAVDQARVESDSTKDQVTAQVAKLYSAALRATAALETAKANVTLSEALLKVARDQKNSGTGTGLEVTRAQVQLANDRQRLLVAENEHIRAHRQLLKALDMNLDAVVVLTDKLKYTPVDPVTLEQALGIAMEARADLKAQQKREETAQLNYSATKLERLPSVIGFADYGSIGPSIHRAVPTRTYGFSVRLPIFDGGRRDARRSESLSLLRQERIRSHDLRAQIGLDVRLALDSLRSAEEQVKVAEEGLLLAEAELAHARRRYEAGVGSSLEVTDAQTRLARARDNQIVALFHYDQARIDLGQATGTIRRMIQ